MHDLEKWEKDPAHGHRPHATMLWLWYENMFHKLYKMCWMMRTHASTMNKPLVTPRISIYPVSLFTLYLYLPRILLITLTAIHTIQYHTMSTGQRTSLLVFENWPPLGQLNVICVTQTLILLQVWRGTCWNTKLFLVTLKGTIGELLKNLAFLDYRCIGANKVTVVASMRGSKQTKNGNTQNHL